MQIGARFFIIQLSQMQKYKFFSFIKYLLGKPYLYYINLPINRTNASISSLTLACSNAAIYS